MNAVTRYERVKTALCQKMRDLHFEKMQSDASPAQKAVFTARAKEYCEMYGEEL